MGSSNSKTTGLVDVKKCTRYNKAPQEFQEYAEGASDMLLGVAGCLEKICAKFDRQCFAIMTDKEQENFKKLEQRKVKVVDKTHSFIQKEGARFRMMLAEAKPGVSMKSLLRNVDVDKHSNHITELMDQLSGLAIEYKAFKGRLENAMRKDGRNSKENMRLFVKIAAGTAAIVCGLVAFVFLCIHFAPGALVLTKVGWGWTVGLASTAVVSTAILGTVFAQSEIDRTLKYLGNLQANLKLLKGNLRKIQTDTTELTEGQSTEHFKNICTDLIARCKQVESICEEVETSTFT